MEKKIFTMQIDSELLKEFKILAIKKGVSASKLVRDFMEASTKPPQEFDINSPTFTESDEVANGIEDVEGL